MLGFSWSSLLSSGLLPPRYCACVFRFIILKKGLGRNFQGWLSYWRWLRAEWVSKKLKNACEISSCYRWRFCKVQTLTLFLSSFISFRPWVGWVWMSDRMDFCWDVSIHIFKIEMQAGSSSLMEIEIINLGFSFSVLVWRIWFWIRIFEILFYIHSAIYISMALSILLAFLHIYI